MKPTIPTVDPLPLPAPPWLLWFLLILTFVLHVIAMNFILGGSLVAAVSHFRRDEHGARLAKAFGKALPTIFSAAVTFGVAPLLFLQALYGRLFFSSTVIMGWFWFAIVPVLIVAYYAAYAAAFHSRRAVQVAIPVILLAISFVYSNNMTLMLRPEQFLTKYVADGRGVQLNLADPTLFPRWLHMILGAVAVAGMIVALYGLAKLKTDQEHGRWAIRQGTMWFVVPTLANLVTGVLWLGALPSPVLLRFMGRSPLATTWLALGIILGFFAMAMMLMKRVLAAAGLLLGTLLMMVLARDEVRRGMLDLAGYAIPTRIEPQWGVIAIFAVLLVAALGTTAWMVKIVLRPGSSSLSAE